MGLQTVNFINQIAGACQGRGQMHPAFIRDFSVKQPRAAGPGRGTASSAGRGRFNFILIPGEETGLVYLWVKGNSLAERSSRRSNQGGLMFLSHRKLGGLLFLAVILLTVSPSQGGTITENFTNNQYNTDLWWIYSIGQGATATVTNNRLEITLPASSGGSLYLGNMGSNFTLVGDFDMQADFTLLTWPTNNASQVGLTISQANDFSIFRRSRGLNEGGGGEIYFTMIKGHMTQVSAAGTSGKLRMTRTGNTMQGFYWDGASWQLVGSSTDPSLGLGTTVHLDFDRDTSFSGPSVKAAFDNVQLTYTRFGGKYNPAILQLLMD